MRQPGRADLEDRRLSHIDVVDHDVDVELLRAFRIRPPWPSQIRRPLEGETMTVGVIHHDPTVALAHNPHAQ